jgi:hypothetical protein
MKSLYIFTMYFLFVTVVVNQFLPVPEIVYIVASSTGLILFLLSTLWRNRGFMQIASIVALVIGHGLLFGYDLGFKEWHTSLTKGIFLPMLFVVIPLIAVPINNGGYFESIEHFVTDRRHRIGQVYLTLAVINLALAVALNIASIIIFQRLLDPLNMPRKFLARLYMAVYGSYMVFSPYDPALNMILLYQGVSYSDYFLPGLALVIAIMGIGVFLVRIDRRLLVELDRRLPPASGTHSIRKLVELMAHVLMLIMLAFLGSLFIPETPTILIVAGIIVLYSLVWTTLVGAFDALKTELQRYSKNFDNYVQFLPFLIALSFFGSAVSLTPINEHIDKILVYLLYLPPYFMLLSFMLLVAVLSLCGIHMIIPVTTLALTMTPASINLTPEAFISLLMSSWVSGMIISPLIPFTVIASSTIRAKATTFAYRWGPTMLIPWVIVAPGVIIGINYLTQTN